MTPASTGTRTSRRRWKRRCPRSSAWFGWKASGLFCDKTTRIGKLAAGLAEDLPPEEQKTVKRAALLAKSDLVTEMIKDGKEFTALQGVIGREYATRQGEPAAVALALEEQYRPRFAGDALPESNAGALLALADRLDTMVGVWAAGLKPTGSKDPFALRRGALGVVRILLDRGRDVSVTLLLESAARGYGDAVQDPAAIVRGKRRSSFATGWPATSSRRRASTPTSSPPSFAWPARTRWTRARAPRRSPDSAIRAPLRGLRGARGRLQAGEEHPEEGLRRRSAPGRAPAGGGREARSSTPSPPSTTRWRRPSASTATRTRSPISPASGRRSTHSSITCIVLADDESVRTNRLRLLGRIVDRVAGAGRPFPHRRSGGAEGLSTPRDADPIPPSNPGAWEPIPYWRLRPGGCST